MPNPPLAPAHEGRDADANMALSSTATLEPSGTFAVAGDVGPPRFTVRSLILLDHP